MKVLKRSKNKYAEAIIKNQVPQKIFESFNEGQEKTLNEIEAYLMSENIEYIRSSSQGRLSKYYVDESSSSKFDMKVVRKLFNSNDRTIFNINEATDLFTKFSKSHAVNRLHCEFDLLSNKQKHHIKSMLK
jgi:hypothetical protein